jgi:hypothetical protein
MDMTNFIRQSQTNGHVDPSNNNNNNNNPNRDQYINNSKLNKNGTKTTNNGISLVDIKRKASSLDSINAVERELDEVLKDLELNSQDLNEQLEENELNMKIGNNTNKTVELPIIIQQKNFKLESISSCSSNSCPSPSVSMNKNNMNCDKSNMNANKSEFVRSQNNCELFIDDCDDVKSLNDSSSNKNINDINGVRKRQNIISTYELCHDCFDQSLLTSNSSKTNKNNFHNCNETAKVSSPVNGNNHFHHQHPPHIAAGATTSTYNHMISPLKFSSSYSNQELSNSPNGHYYNASNGNNNHFQHHAANGESLSMNNVYQNGNSNGRSRSVLTQINESVIPENNFKTAPSSMQQFGRNINKSYSNGVSNNNNNHNGNVISQKVISIGMPSKNLIRDGDLSPSPKLIDNKSKQFFFNINESFTFCENLYYIIQIFTQKILYAQYRYKHFKRFFCLRLFKR